MSTRNIDWTLPSYNTKTKTISNDDAKLAVLMDIRHQLVKLNSLLHCQNFQDIPKHLKKMAVRKKRKPKKESP